MLLLKQARLLDPVDKTDKIADVFIAEGKIQAIETNLTSFPEATKIIAAQGMVLGPGLVDLYSHSGEPGHEERETLASLTAAALAGGFTRLNILPDTIPTIDHPSALGVGQKLLASKIQVNFWGALTLGVAGKQMSEVTELADKVIGFADGYPLENLNLLRRLLEYLKPNRKPVALVARNSQLRGNGVVREGAASLRFGLPGNPAVSEAAAIASLLELVAVTETPVHLMRVSTRRGVELIADAKARGLPITASTTWMHLLLNTDSVSTYDASVHLEPPLGLASDMLALIAGVKTGVIDAIAIDHAPYTYEEKTVAFAAAPPGAIGLELALPLLWQRFVATGQWSALDLWHRLSVAPMKCLQQQPRSCSPGQPAELVLFDPQKTWTVNRQTLKSLSSNTPWFGQELTGQVVNICLSN